MLNPSTINVLLIALGPMIPLLTYVFVTNLVAWQRDIADQRAADASYRDALWRQDWAFWYRLTEDDNCNTRALAQQMLGILATERPVTA